MAYCYDILGVDFPERGFLLFWQLPLDDKLKYFQIEDEIAALKNVANAADRRKRLDRQLAFLGANPVQKVDRAFAARFGSPMMTYLGFESA
jgi:phosphoglucomutase/phosphomannomutase